MLSINKIVKGLNENDFYRLKSSLESTRAFKFADLLASYRQGEEEAELPEKLNVSKNAFNVLKSRLYEKLQKFLINSGEYNIESLFATAIHIPEIIYTMERNLAITLLEGLEKQFLDLDLPEYLTLVHGAQKRLYYSTSKYYHYSKLYNKSVAYQLSLNKAEDELIQYKGTLRKYYLTGDRSLINTILFHKKEIEHLARMNDSPRFEIFQNMIRCSIAMHFPDLEENGDLIIDKTLLKTKKIIQSLPGNVFAGHYLKATNTMLFNFYCKANLFYNASEFLDESLNEANELISYSRIICLRPYLESRLTYAIKMNAEPVIFKIEPSDLEEKEMEEIWIYGAILKYNALAYIVKGDLHSAFNTIKYIYNSVSFKPIPVVEIEIKILYVLLSFLLKKDVNTEAVIGSISRKNRESQLIESEKELICLILKLLKLKASGNIKKGDSKTEMIIKEIQEFQSVHFLVLQKILSCELFKNLFLK